MLPQTIHSTCADLMQDLIDETRHLAGHVRVNVHVFPKHYGCLVKTKIVRRKSANEVYVSRLWMRVNNENIGRAHLFFGQVKDLAIFLNN